MPLTPHLTRAFQPPPGPPNLAPQISESYIATDTVGQILFGEPSRLDYHFWPIECGRSILHVVTSHIYNTAACPLQMAGTMMGLTTPLLIVASCYEIARVSSTPYQSHICLVCIVHSCCLTSTHKRYPSNIRAILSLSRVKAFFRGRRPVKYLI